VAGGERAELSADQLAAHDALLLVGWEEWLQVIGVNWTLLQPIDDPLVDDLGPVGFEFGGFLDGPGVGQGMHRSAFERFLSTLQLLT
jgi:hypothetical protein